MKHDPNEIQTNRQWDRYGSDPTPFPTPTTHTGIFC